MADSANLPAVLARAAHELLPAPLQAAIELLNGTIAPGFAPPDLEAAAVGALQDDVVRLYRLMIELRERLSAEITAKMDPIETLELATQTFSNMARTAHSERRRLMANVLVNGLSEPDADGAERRFFVRAVADLDVAHIDLLREFERLDGSGQELRLDDLDRALLFELVGRSMIHEERAAAWGGDIGLARQEISALGRRFLGYLRDPEGAEP